MPRLITSLTMAAAILAGLLGASTASAQARAPRVTVLGDSVQASFSYVPQAVRRLGKGYDLRVDAKVCRRLVSASCAYQGSTPASALSVIQSSGDSLGRTVVVNVGYNDDPYLYARHLDQTMRALKAAGVVDVVWVTLRESRSIYATTNAAIRAGAKRWPKMMTVADWNAVSTGKNFFGGDGLHLNTSGAMALAGLLRVTVREAMAS